MHPLLVDFSIFTIDELVKDSTTVLKFMSDLGLIPNRTNPPTCPKCSGKMHAVSWKLHQTGFRFICNSKHTQKCNGYVNPAENTFVSNTRILYRDILAIVFLFVLKFRITDALNHMTAWRARRKEPSISSETLCDWYHRCRTVAVIHASHSYDKLDETTKPYTEKRAVKLYFLKRIDTIKDFGGKIQRFMEDIVEVYPGYRNGTRCEGLKLLQLIMPKSNSINIVDPIPRIKRLKTKAAHALKDKVLHTDNSDTQITVPES